MKIKKEKIFIIVSLVASVLTVFSVLFDTVIPSIQKNKTNKFDNDTLIQVSDTLNHTHNNSIFIIDNYFIPSGYMGDGEINGIQLQKQNFENCIDNNCIKITYSPKTYSWGGIYWLYPADNWGDKKGLDLSNKNISKVSFWAKGENGGEIVRFKLGGINTGKFHDSFETSFQLTLSREWKYYSKNIGGKDLSNVIGGFCFVLRGSDNYGITTFYLDKIVYE